MIAIIASSVALLIVSGWVARHLYVTKGRSAYIRQLRTERIRRSKRKTKSDCVWIPTPTRW